MSRDEELLLEAFQLLYQLYKVEKSGRRYYRPVSIYPVLAKIQRRLDTSVARKLADRPCDDKASY